VVHSDVIRAVINIEHKTPSTKKEKEIKGLPVTEDTPVKLEPLGNNRDKNRIWSFDSKTTYPSLCTLPNIRFSTYIQVRKPLQTSLPSHPNNHDASRARSPHRDIRRTQCKRGGETRWERSQGEIDSCSVFAIQESDKREGG
jgi:hypothetical protein